MEPICYVRQKKAALGFVFIVSMSYGQSEALTRFSFDETMFNSSIKLLSWSARMGLKALLHSPRTMILFGSLFFYKEILALTKDLGVYLVGDHPYVSLIVLAALFFYMANYSSPKPLANQKTATSPVG